MTSYNNFIGIDMGKFSFTVAVHRSQSVQEYENSFQGIHRFINDYKQNLTGGLCVLETTGGYELELLLTLCDHGYAVHRANTRLVKNFIRSLKNAVKTDALDAKALALYAHERWQILEVFVPQSPKALELFELVQRRHDLKKMLVAEKNRKKSPHTQYVLHTFDPMIKVISDQILSLTESINEKIEQDNVLKERKKVLKTIPGVGDIIGGELLILLPELGTLNRRQIASLAGVAPRANDSGKYRGYRSTGHGRGLVKPMLFLAAMAARNSRSTLRTFYEKLIANGKRKMVALVALMRKIIVIANARIKEFNQKSMVATQA